VRNERPDQTALTVAEVATRYGVSEYTVLAWIRSGALLAMNVARTPGAKKPRWRITQVALVEFEAARTQTPAVPRTRRKRAGDAIKFY
jgi:hypothetical protein